VLTASVYYYALTGATATGKTIGDFTVNRKILTPLADRTDTVVFTFIPSKEFAAEIAKLDPAKPGELKKFPTFSVSPGIGLTPVANTPLKAEPGLPGPYRVTLNQAGTFSVKLDGLARDQGVTFTLSPPDNKWGAPIAIPLNTDAVPGVK
jgi:hypothetical protein